MTGSASQDGGPEGRIGRLLCRTQEEDAVRNQETVDAAQQCSTGFVRKVQHHIAQKDDVEALAIGQSGIAQVGDPEMAEPADFVFGDPVFFEMIEKANDISRGKATVHFDAMVTAATRALNDFPGDIASVDADIPMSKRGKVFSQQHCERVSFLPRGAGGAPDAEAPREATGLNEAGQDLGTKEFKGPIVAEEAGFVDGHGFSNGALQLQIFPDAQEFDKFFQVIQSFVPQKPCEPDVE